MRKWATALLLSAMVLSGCIGEDSGESENAAMWDEGLTQLSLEGLDDIRNFSVAYAFDNDSIGESNWAVFGNEEGGNCCEHYLATVSYTHLRAHETS